MSSHEWDWFCGENWTVTDENFLHSSCKVNTVIVVPQVVFIVLFSAILLILQCCLSYGKRTASTCVFRLPGHSPRWLLTLVYVVLALAMMGEGVLTNDTYLASLQSNRPYLYTPGLVLMISAVASLAYYDRMERWRAKQMSWILVLYWTITLLTLILRMVHLDKRRLNDLQIVCFDVTLVLIILLTVMLIIELVLFYSMFCHGSVDPLYTPIPNEATKGDMKYYHEFTNIISTLTYWWMNWLFAAGYKKAIEPSDLGSIPDCHTAETNHQRFKESFLKEKERATHRGCEISMYRIYWRTYGFRVVMGGFFKLCADFANYIGPLCISGIILYVTNAVYITDTDEEDDAPHHVTTTEFFSNGYILVVCIFIASVMKGILEQTYFYWTYIEGLHVRSAIQSMVYEKSLRLSTYAMSGGMMTVGQITNHMSIDATNVQFFFQYGIEIITTPIRIAMTLYLLYLQLGTPSLIGASLFILVVPFQVLLAGFISKYMKDVLIRSDQRMKYSNELLQGIKILKLYGWERLYCEIVKSARKRELRKLAAVFVIQGVNFLVNIGVPIAVNLVSFGTYTAITGKSLSPDVAFSALYLFNSLVDPMFVFPYVVSLFVNSHISTRRIKFFLVAPEIEGKGGKDFGNDMNKNGKITRQTKNVKITSSPDEDLTMSNPLLPKNQKWGKSYHSMESSAEFEQNLPDDVAIRVHNGSFTWDPDSTVPILKDINVDIPRGKLTVIVGTVGSGKSSILQAVLGEMTTLKGKIQIRKGALIAYGPQKAWLVNTSLRENVLFGESYEPNQYRKVIDACALAPDIEMLPGGDETEIGEKGLNLSGGQKQRVSVARTIYSGRDIIILDDPLSALDMHVGSHLFENGILNILKKQKQTVILVTHQLQYLPEADKIIIMKEGRILRQGEPDEIAQADPAMAADWQRAINELSESEAELSGGESEATIEERRSLKKQISQLSVKSGAHSDIEDDRGRLIAEEDQEKGSVSYRIYLYYLKAVNYVVAFLTIAAVAFGAGLEIGTNFWLAIWSEASLETNDTQAVIDDTNYYISIYAIFAGCNVFCKVMSIIFVTVGIYHAAKNLHNQMLNNIIAVPLRFFDTTPTGRILNRFSSDTQLIDQRLIQSIRMMINLGSLVISAFVVIVAVNIYFIFFILPVAIIFILLCVYYVITSRELQRCESVTRSPVFAHFSETLGGLPTIRAFQNEKRFFQTILDRILVNNTVFLYLLTAQRWIGVRLELLGAVVVFFSSLLCLLGAFYFGIDASYVGLAISYSLEISLFMNLTVRAAAEVELQMNAVERVKYYAEIPNEDYGGIEPPPSWPSAGEIEIDGAYVRYARDLDAVLNDITLTVPPSDKLGICGRTGSGKSSLTLALFRIIDTFKGRILIDGVDIASVPLLILRQRLSIIPQDAFLFTGTIRSNLDPTDSKTEDELWHALEISQLKDVVTQLDEGLEYQVTEGGDNFSVGQRQLFCLARAFLRNSKIVIMDEATASIDRETDLILQDVVADVFQDRTVLTIAHRVATIMNADKILTLSDGRVIEYDSPGNLLNNEDSVFASLVKAGK